MIRAKTSLRTVSVLFVILLLTLSFLLVACGSRVRNTPDSNVSSSANQQTTPTQTSASSSSTNTSGSASGDTSQQIQDAIQAINNAQQDVNSADATAATENGSNEQP
ncbi:MAG TPA: hypothetical protein VFN35_18425 [Ktedonobacteraceae bacterium]|nr:hypothetical protein [Ktedonobacteraceae bacterium]